jgi:hypothetical protein
MRVILAQGAMLIFSVSFQIVICLAQRSDISKGCEKYLNPFKLL